MGSSDETPAETSDAALQTRAAWYYFTGGLTQKAIASRLGITQAKVNRLLAAARENGQLEVTIDSDLVDCVALEHALIERFGLRQAVVVPAWDDPTRHRESLGVGAAAYVDDLLTSEMTLALGWGRTIAALIDNLPARRLRDLGVVGLQGGLAHCAQFNTFEVVSDLAALYDADQHFFTAPLYVDGPDARERLLAHEPIRATCDKAANADLGLITMGGMDDSMALSYGINDPYVAAELREMGAVGDVLGYFIDAGGCLVDHPVNDRTVALPLDSLASIKRTVAVGGGSSRLAIVRATLVGGYAGVLVTDERTAGALVADG
jgi:DNA-binding transcriptional regulator LsrR (DeoR family)